MSAFDRHGGGRRPHPVSGRAAAEADRLRRRAWWIAGGYFVLASAWIVFSDGILDAVVNDPELRSDLGTVKGWCFVTVTSLLLLGLIRGAFSRMGGAYEDLEDSDLQLLESNEALRSLIESIPQVVWIGAPDGSVSDFNGRWEEYAGHFERGDRDAGWFPNVHPDDVDDARARWSACVGSGAPFECELRLRRVDGVHHWMLGRALAMRDPSGAIVCWFGTFTDIEELKQVQERIAAQARLLDLTQDSIVVHDLDHRIYYWNKGAERLHGWSADEAVGHLIGDLHCPNLEQLTGVLEELLEHGEWSGEIQLVNRSGDLVTAEGRWTLVRGADGEPASILAVSTDISARKRMEAQFLRTQRLESIGTLAGGIAHDLNNLLAPITMGVELLRLRTTERDTLELIDAMDVSAQRCAALVQRVLAFARGVENARSDVDLRALIDEVVAIARATFPKGISVMTDVAEDLRAVRADQTQLGQVVLNLCVNARDAMADRGHLLVRARNVDGWCGLGGTDPARSGVIVEVADNGSGMPADLLPRIFEPFVTTKERDGGTGLGLSTVRGIVESHGGTVAVESTLGVGTRFTVFLPAAPVPVPA